jgi:hypothetical protein
MSDPILVTRHAHVHWTGRCGRANEPRRAIIEAVYRSREAEPYEARAADWHFKTHGHPNPSSLMYRVDEDTGILVAIFPREEDEWVVITCQLLEYLLDDHNQSRRYLKRALRWKRKCRKILRLTDAERLRLVEGRQGVLDEAAH